MRIRQILIIVTVMFFIGTANAFTGITYYGTKITNKDRHNSYGDRLTSVSAILRQDRANYHEFHRSDSDDQADGYFKSAGKRQLFDQVRVHVSPQLRRKILGNEPVLVTVFVFHNKIEVTQGLPDPNVD